MNRIESIITEIESLKQEIRTHPVYHNLKTIDDIKLFMEYHVFAVWDFMSLIKHLQIELTCTSLPWLPPKNPTLARFVNEIVHGEESDLNANGIPKSHFEMYVSAMEELGACTERIHLFIASISKGASVQEAIEKSPINNAIKDFVSFTFSIIDQNEAHKTAASFTFGREDLIPDMFIEIVEQSDTTGKQYDHFMYYLQRHIELDGDEHGPLSLQLVSELCGDDDHKWNDALQIAVESLKQRIKLWDAINDAIVTTKTKTSRILVEN